ncbi:18566_t:CDS:2 [Racocetra fulgida]|uniref:18566_t:CDS:1 n=1 Tax=Racocetra fulgida TaxID=60492 RepID=A0A9N8Z0J3_9GLOM|nr:18566_t:CDS:2 [Racocetra fulgida]
MKLKFQLLEFLQFQKTKKGELVFPDLLLTSIVNLNPNHDAPNPKI